MLFICSADYEEPDVSSIVLSHFHVFTPSAAVLTAGS